MRPRIVSLAPALLVVALAATGATAQVRFDRLEVVLWPEYDRSAVLVMLRGTLSADTTLPSIVPLPMPTAAGTPHAVAKQGPNGNLLVAQYSVETDGDWSTVKVLTDSPTIRLEYYVSLDVADPQRRHSFFWPPGVPIERLAYEVLHPIGASNMTVTPPADAVVEADGLTFYRAELGARPGSEPFSLTFAYAKQTSALSSPAAQAAPPAPVAQPQEVTEDPASSSTWIPLALIGLAVVIGLALMFSRPGKPSAD